MDKENDSATANAALEGEHVRRPDELRLQAVAGPSQGTVYGNKDGAMMTVGRTRNSTVFYKDPAVSEKHAEFVWEGGSWRLQDVGSSNGTWVNGNPLKGGPVELKDGDLIRFGTDTEVAVEVSSALDSTVTVEQYLQVECQRMIHRVKAVSEQLANNLRDSWKIAKRELEGSLKSD